jgi:hypothetical protein
MNLHQLAIKTAEQGLDTLITNYRCGWFDGGCLPSPGLFVVLCLSNAVLTMYLESVKFLIMEWFFCLQ